jgi:NADPH:quinone reductase-like Zn-dependent oxidoreductase
MYGIVLEQSGSFAGLRYREVPQPVPQADEVLVAVSASAVHPSDTENAMEMRHHTKLPRISGRDFVGVVVEGLDDITGMTAWGTGSESGCSRDAAHAECTLLFPCQFARYLSGPQTSSVLHQCESDRRWRVGADFPA